MRSLQSATTWLALGLPVLSCVACRQPAPEPVPPEASRAPVELEPAEVVATAPVLAAAGSGVGTLDDPPAAVDGSGAAELPPPAVLRAPVPIVVAGHSHAPLRCALEGAVLGGPTGFDVVRDLESTGEHLWVADADANILRFVIEANDTSCVLRLDTGFGEDGVFDAPRDIETLSADASGRLVASSGIFESYVFEPGANAPTATCGDAGHGFLTQHPTAGYALGRFVGRDIREVTLSGAVCSGAAWTHAPVFSNVQAIGFAHGLTLVGGLGDEESPTGRATQLLAVRDTAAAWRQGAVGDPFASDAYSWIHQIEACGVDICVLDAHARALHVVGRGGEHLGRIELAELLGHTYPMVGDFDVDVAGVGWMSAAEERGADVAYFDGYIYRIPAF